MQEIVKFSMGICSAYIACRLKEMCSDPICVFNDTKAEDEDTYRFGREITDRWKLNVVEANDGRHLWDLFRENKMIPVRQISMCSKYLKIIPGEKWFKAWPKDNPARVAFGYDTNEGERAENLRKFWKYDHLKLWFPLQEWGVSKEECFGFFNEKGIAPPRMYRHFRHANCLPCKNFRINDWVALKFHYPEKFAEAEAFEREMGLRWMQDGPLLSEVPDVRPKGRRLPMATPSFNFEMDCDACTMD